MICLKPELTKEEIRAKASIKPERVVCLDSGFVENAQRKTNAVEIIKTQEITSFKTV